MLLLLFNKKININLILKEGEVIDDEVVFKHTATLTKRQAMSVIKRVNTLNDTIRRKRVVPTQNDINQKPKQLSSTSMSSITQSMIQQQQQQQQQQPQSLQRSTNNLQHQSLSPQHFQNVFQNYFNMITNLYYYY